MRLIKKYLLIIIVLLITGIFIFFKNSFPQKTEYNAQNISSKIEKLHGYKVDTNLISGQHWSGNTFHFSVVKLSARDLNSFLSKFRIWQKTLPKTNRPTNPNIFGYGSYPENSPTYVADGFEENQIHFFEDNAKPIAMYSCASELGVWLHIDTWECSDGNILARMFTCIP